MRIAGWCGSRRQITARAAAAGLGLALALLVAGVQLPPVVAESGTAATAASRYFVETGQWVTGDFLTYFNRNGSTAVFGMPRTGIVEEDGRKMQYFQRARLEYWPELAAGSRVQLTLLGDMLAGSTPGIERAAAPAGSRWYAETRQAVAPAFLAFFDANGGPATFGFPISASLTESGRTVQRFQRLVLELHPENTPQYRVQPRLLGDQLLAMRNLPASVTAPQRRDSTPEPLQATSWVTWSSWTTGINQWYANKRVNMRLSANYTNGTVIQPGEVFHFSSVLEARGYLQGLCYGADKYVVCEAGGACAGATALYRAWFNAGLEIIQVNSHSFEAYQPLGWDATVYTPTLDLVLRNNTTTPIRILSPIDANGNLSYVIQGRSPAPWSVTRIGPLRQSEFGYRVGRRIVDAAGTVLSEDWRSVTYSGGNPPTEYPEGWRF